MKRLTGFFLLMSVCSFLITSSLLHGCGSKEDATGPGTNTPPGVKFTIVGAGK
jgi:hypothetical protein